MGTVKELRCPLGPRRLFALLLDNADALSSDMKIEVACYDCRKSLQRDGVIVDIVLHRYNTDGTLSETITLPD